MESNEVSLKNRFMNISHIYLCEYSIHQREKRLIVIFVRGIKFYFAKVGCTVLEFEILLNENVSVH